MAGITFKCKYCKKGTDHVTIQKIERNGRPGLHVRCMVCKYESAVYRGIHGKLEIDESKIPERKVLMPWDDEYVRMK